MLDHVPGQCTGVRSSAVFYDAVLALLGGRAGYGPSATTATARSGATRDGNNVEDVRHAPEPGDVITDGFESRH